MGKTAVEIATTVNVTRRMMMKIKLDDGAYVPTRAHGTDAGLDIRSKDRRWINGHSAEVFRTGVHVQLPKGTARAEEGKVDRWWMVWRLGMGDGRSWELLASMDLFRMWR